jgi:CO/xanthine dehydrogenase FAD-binding subunit
MEETANQAREREGVIHTPRSFQEFFSTWNRFPGALLWAGAFPFGAGPGGDAWRDGNSGSATSIAMSRNVIALDRIEELRRITRSERYLETGSLVRLNEVIRIGKTVPAVLSGAFSGAASSQLRNLISIGELAAVSAPRKETALPAGETDAGNAGTDPEKIFSGRRNPGAVAAFIALDARFELRSADSARWISAGRFYSPSQGPEIPVKESPAPLRFPKAVLRLKKAGREAGSRPRQELLSRVRIPLEQWNYSVFRQFRAPPGQGGAVVVIAHVEKNMLGNLRVVFADHRVIRSLAGESALNGKNLPLERRYATHFMELWENALDEAEPGDPMIRSILLNCIEESIQGLSG